MLILPPAFADALLPRYRLGAPIAEGGQALVVQATDEILHREVALKILPRSAASAVAIERFLREIRLLADITHPYVIPIVDTGESEEVLWYAMPLVRGHTLAARLADGPVNPGELRRWGVDLSEALAAAHDRGVVHRDVKPANVYIVEGHALLADFGVASLRGDEDTLTGTGVAIGTARYMAPEQRSGTGDARVDVYALGATLYEAATGSRWEAGAPEWGRVPRELRATLRRAVATVPERRWHSARAFGAALARRGHRATWTTASLLAAGGLALAATVVSTGGTRPERHFSAEVQFLGFEGDPLGEALIQATVRRLEWFPPLGSLTRDARTPATWRITGTIERAPGVVTASLQVRDTLDRVGRIKVAGDSANLPAWADRVALEVVRRVAPARLHDFELFGGGPHDIEAMHLYYAAQEKFERQDWQGANEGFLRALELDSTLTSARWHAMLAKLWARDPYEQDLIALARDGRLAPPLDALVALQLEPDLRTRMTGLDSLAAARPRVWEVQLIRANELFHRGPLVGRTLSEGLAAFEAGARNFPMLDRPAVWDQVVWGSVRLGDEPRARAALRARNMTAADDDRWGPLLRYATESRFRPRIGRALETVLRMAGGAERDHVNDAYRLGVTLDLPGVEARLAAWVGDAEATVERRGGAWSAIAVARLLEGRPLAALAALDTAATLSPVDKEIELQRWEWRLLLPVAGIPVPSAEQQRARSKLTAVVGAGRARASLALGLDALAHDDTVSASLHIARLREPGVPPLLWQLASAHLAAARDATTEALAMTPDLWREPRHAEFRALGPFPRVLGYLARADWLLAVGDTMAADFALRWHENSDLRGWPSGAPQAGELDAALSGIARIRRSRLLTLRGKTDEACLLREQVAALWRDAEPPLRAQLEDDRGEAVRCRR